MQTKILLATLAATATASILPRQTSGGGISKACESDLAEADIPTPPASLVTAMPNNLEDICDFKPTGSVSSAYSSYTEEVMSWAKDNEDLFKKIKEDCAGGLEIPDFSVCQKSGDNDDNDDKDDKDDKDSKDSKDDKDGAGVANAPTAMGALLVAGMAVVAAL
ncbi:hypothetical protein K4F52_004885 [Lecanicillium sp. MT-2017a]|nr:hypothetical protein K4F52_004885 [Lecanicillium sp. MT-2017a]